MRTIANIVALLGFAALTAYTITGPALAGWTCQQVGNFTYCHNSQTGQRYTCQQVGNHTYCN
jgi:hypothetical protein